MASLTETAYIARRAIKYGSIGLVAVTVLWFVGTGAIAWWKATHPEPPPPPTADFGPLPAISFPKSNFSVKEFLLQTPDGRLPAFPDRADVYLAPTRRSGFGQKDQADELARKLDFLFEPTKISNEVYRFTTQDPLPSTLEINIVTGKFSLKRQWAADPSLITNKLFESEAAVIREAGNKLRQWGVNTGDILGNEKLTFLRATGDKLSPVSSLSEADFVEVDMFRAPVQLRDAKKKVVASYGFYTPDPAKGPVSFLVAGTNDDKKQIVQIEYQYVETNYEVKGEYPLKSIEVAFEELKSGAGYVAGMTPAGSKAIIRRVNLGYYDSMGEQKYAMPIYVFSGDNNFVAYVSAVDDSIISK